MSSTGLRPFASVLALGAFSLIGCAVPESTRTEPAERPNVLFISVDDLNDSPLGGHPLARTPNLEPGTLHAQLHGLAGVQPLADGPLDRAPHVQHGPNYQYLFRTPKHCQAFRRRSERLDHAAGRSSPGENTEPGASGTRGGDLHAQLHGLAGVQPVTRLWKVRAKISEFMDLTFG